MKTKILIGLAAGLLVLGATGMAQALTIDSGIYVGDEDQYLIKADLPDSGDATELAWVNNYLLSEGLISDPYTSMDKYDNTGSEWTQTNELPDLFAFELETMPTYYFIKIGAGPGEDDHYLFENKDSINYAVINFADLGLLSDDMEVLKLSHLGEMGKGSVPEPSTLLLFGTGLIGLAGISRQRKKNN